MKTLKQVLESGLWIKSNNFSLWAGDDGYYWVTDDRMNDDDQLEYPVYIGKNLKKALTELEKAISEQ